MTRWRRGWRSLSGPRGSRYAVILLFATVIGLTGGSYALTVSAIHRAEHASASVAQLCRAGNEARAEQVTLWDHFAAISKPPPHQTAAQTAARRRQIASILAYIRHVFRPRDCAQPSRTELTP